MTHSAVRQLGLPNVGGAWSATISECGLYRWRLSRQLKVGGPVVCFVLCNPALADEKKNDPTTRRCIGFGQELGAGEVVLVNLFAYRSANPKALEWIIKHEGIVKAVGPGNGRRLYTAIKEADRVVVGWGSLLKPWSTERGEQLRRDIADLYKELWCLGTNFDGAPRHPLYVAAGTKLVRWHGNSAHARRDDEGVDYSGTIADGDAAADHLLER